MVIKSVNVDLNKLLSKVKLWLIEMCNITNSWKWCVPQSLRGKDGFTPRAPGLFRANSSPAGRLRKLKSIRQKGGRRLEFSPLLRGTKAVAVLAFVLLSVKQSSSPCGNKSAFVTQRQPAAHCCNMCACVCMCLCMCVCVCLCRCLFSLAGSSGISCLPSSWSQGPWS